MLRPPHAFGFWIELGGPLRLWVASIVFVLVGALVGVVLPAQIPSLSSEPVARIGLLALGWTFIALGLLVLLPMLVTLLIARRDPDAAARWRWWINLIGGMAGALAFAIPATLALPLFYAAWLQRPNVLMPTEAVVEEHLWLGALFTVLGVLTLFGLWFIARYKLRHDIRRI